jgi:hypothetical protein
MREIERVVAGVIAAVLFAVSFAVMFCVVFAGGVVMLCFLLTSLVWSGAVGLAAFAFDKK